MELPDEILAIIRDYSPCFEYFREQNLLTRLSGRSWPRINEDIQPYVFICIIALESNQSKKEKKKAMDHLNNVWSLFSSLDHIKHFDFINRDIKDRIKKALLR